jgi:hypothetical protein
MQVLRRDLHQSDQHVVVRRHALLQNSRPMAL